MSQTERLESEPTAVAPLEPLLGQIRLRPGEHTPIAVEGPGDALRELPFEILVGSKGTIFLHNPATRQTIEFRSNGVRLNVLDGFQACTLTYGDFHGNLGEGRSFLRVEGRDGCLILTKEGLKEVRIRPSQREIALVAETVRRATSVASSGDTGAAPPIEEVALSPRAREVRAVMDEFVESEYGRPSTQFGALRTAGRFDSENLDDVRLAFDYVLEQVDQASFERLLRLFSFCNDFRPEHGGRVDALLRPCDGLPVLKIIYSGLSARLLTAFPAELNPVFEDLYARVVPLDFEIDGCEDTVKKLALMKTALSVVAKPFDV